MDAFEIADRGLATTDGRRFPVRRVYCVGRNYAEHAREMGDDGREPPFFFMKPRDAAFTVSEGWRGRDPGVVPHPPQTSQLEHEVELVVALGPAAAGTGVAIWGYGVAVDLTRRDLQNEAKELRRPWDLAKGFDASAPMSLLMPGSDELPGESEITLSVDGEIRQRGRLDQQIWDVPELLERLSRSVALEAGDVLLTGTPAGVGPLDRGSRVEGAIEGVGSLSFTVR